MTDRSVLLDLIEAVPGTSVLCVGDVMLDRFVHGNVERISPEAPIPVLRIDRETAMLGGAGNVVRNLVALGARARFVAAVGDDGAGREVAALLHEHDAVSATLIAEPGRRTSIKTRYLAGTQQMMRADSETTAPVDDAARAGILDAVARALPDCAVVMLSDYGKGVLPADVISGVIAMARDAGKPLVVDPKGTDYSVYRGASVLTPNLRELGEATRIPVRDADEIVAAARALIAECGIDAVLATRSRDGMTLVERDGGTVHLETEARDVFDVSGAGDTVAATLAAALGVGAGLSVAAALANVAAGIVVGKVGTAVAYTAEVVAALRHRDLSHAEAKVVERDPALDRVDGWRRKGLRVGFTNGCFDFLHPGHVSLLAQAREACDCLVVGLNSDSSVKRLKGPDRPVQSEAARATVLASLATVDMVVIFGEDTPFELIEALRPDVLVKGADYALDQVVGAELVQGYGGSVLLAELSPGHSTTATIARIAK
jgi:D-beta-D-heptose 7-phosphate kinase / D-beta-D-heptose 1-phosphate adenosyltransferase